MSDVVELSIPVQADLVVLARLTAAAVASRAGFDVEEVEDLRLAVDELCISVVEGAGEGRLLLTFTSAEELVEVRCDLDGATGPAADGAGTDDPAGVGADGADGLSGRILDALVDEHGLGAEDGHRHAWLRKRGSRRGG
jgi:hypothetical protein